MKQGSWIQIVIFYLCFVVSGGYAAPLVIAADANSPPFEIQTANKQLYGFDIEMMTELCKIMGRECEFKPMHFRYLLPAIVNNTADLAVGAITITLDRSKLVNFSIPYLLSYGQFIGPAKIWDAKSFETTQLSGKKIGVQATTVFKDAIAQQGIKNVTIVEIQTFATLVEALQNGKIDVALVDAAVAQYWSGLVNNMIIPLGKPFLYGYGFGIAVNINNPELLEKINSALLEYQNNGGFQKTYDAYIARF